MAVHRIIYNYVLPLILLMVVAAMWYMGDSSFYTGAKSVFNTMVDTFVPDFTVGMKSLRVGTTSLEGSVLESVDSLKSALEALSADTTGKNCFVRYRPFSEALGDSTGSASILMDYDEQHDKTRIVVYKRKNVVAGTFEVAGLKPCVIAGYEGADYVARNFYEGMLRGDITSARGQYTYPVDTLQITYAEQKRDGNRISILQLLRGATPDPAVVNDEPRNFEDRGMLFKGPNNEVCFFPTNWWWNADKDGLNKGIVAEFARKFDAGDASVPRCHLDVGYQAVTLRGNMGASLQEMDCADERGAPLDASTRRVYVKQYHQYISALSGRCTRYAPPDPQNSGCVAFLEPGILPTCGLAVVRSGEVIPSRGARSGLKPYTEAPLFGVTSEACLVSHGEWFTDSANSLLCAGNVWQECSPSTTGKDLGVEILSGGAKKDVKYNCRNMGDRYEWEKVDGEMDFQLYRGIELYGSYRLYGSYSTPNSNNLNADEYPDNCDDGAIGVVYSLCDIAGKMGVTGNSVDGRGMFPCPSQDLDCSDEVSASPSDTGRAREFPDLDRLSPDGCQVFLSGKQSGAAAMMGNDCGRAVVPFGTQLGAGASRAESLYRCSGQPSCPAGPIDVTLSPVSPEQGVGCLLKHKWSLPETVRGDLLCAPGDNGLGAWHLCDLRVEGRCITVTKWDGLRGQFCCRYNRNEKTYNFVDTPLSGAPVAASMP